MLLYYFTPNPVGKALYEAASGNLSHAKQKLCDQNARIEKLKKSTGVSSCGSSSNCPAKIPVSISKGCAPWDAITYEIFFDYENARYNVHLWNEGYDAFTKGGAVTVSYSSQSSGTGKVQYCSIANLRACETLPSGDLMVEIPASVIGASDPVPGVIRLKDKTLPVTAGWDPTGPMCL
jgi:hypothetical protein